MAAPAGAEFEQGQAWQGVNFGTRRGFDFAEIGLGWTHDRIVSHQKINANLRQSTL
jgi:hypothetical protein